MEANVLLPSVGCLGFLLVLGLVAYALPRYRSVEQSKAGSSYELREMAGELTPKERRAQIAEDKRTYNKNARLDAFYTGETTYIDADKKRRNL